MKRIVFTLFIVAFAIGSFTACKDKSGGGMMSYEEFWNMDGDEQAEFKESFESVVDFYDWYYAAKAEYEKEHPNTEIENGEDVNLGGK